MIFPDNSASWEPASGFDETDGLIPEIGRGVPLIKVLGVGGGGCNAVSRMYKEKLPVVEYYALNTDAQHLARCDVHYRIALGRNLTRGLGAGAQPELGRQAAEETRSEIEQAVRGADMVFLAVGMGGGTGTGAAPIVAQIARESGALTIAVVSRPFGFEAQMRRRNAEDGLERLKDHVDTMIVIPNDRLLAINEEQSDSYSWEDALKLADSVLHQGISAIAEVVTVPGEINVDFADVKTILTGAGQAWLSIGRGRGEHRARDAARQCTQSPLLDISLEGSRRILFVLTGGNNMTLQEVQEAAGVVEELADPNANIIFGTNRDARLDDEVKMTMVAADFPVITESAEDDIAKLLGEMEVPDRRDYELPTFLQNRQNRRGFFR